MNLPNKLKLSISILIVASCTSVMADSSSVSVVPKSAFFVGIGGSQNKLNYNNQSTWAMGTTSAPAGPSNPAINGSAAGETGVNLSSQDSLSPSVQLGYFSRFENSDFLWGFKFSYSYLGATSKSARQLIPQVGGYTNDTGYNTFNGNYVVRSYEQTIKNQMSLMPFIGHSFSKGYLYAGAGPSLSQVTTNINGITGFADIFGYPSDISGSLQNYSSTQWVVGGSATLGGTYFLGDSFFLDLNYSYTQTKNNTASWGGPWSKRGIYSPTGYNNVQYSGTNVGTSSGNIGTQALTLTLNKYF